jgi:hypothetical protein
MILGMPISTFTTLHVVISLIGIAAGIIVLLAMLGGRHLPGLTFIFLATTVLTSATGFLFPFQTFLPSHAVGALSLLVLAIALLALYAFQLRGSWRWIYVVTAIFALYLNAFVGVVQAFQKVEPLQVLAPTQSEPPFVAAQAIVALLFLVLGGVALRRFHP